MNIKYIRKRGFEPKQRYKKFMPTVFLSLFLIFTVVLLTGLTRYRHLVKIIDETSEKIRVKELSFLGDDVNSILDQEKITLGKNDILNVKKNAGRLNIHIKRGCQVYFSFVETPPEIIDVKPGVSVADILQLKNISYDPSKHLLNHSVDYKVKNGDKIIVDEMSTMRRESSVKQIEIAFPVKEVLDPNLKKGERVVKQKGEVGILEKYDQDELSNGRIVRTMGVENFVKSPKEEVVLLGTKETVPVYSAVKSFKAKRSDSKKPKKTKRNGPSKSEESFVGPRQNMMPNPDDEGWVSIDNSKATAYSIGSRTATGTKVGIGNVAVDFRKIPANSLIEVYDNKGNLYYKGKATDTGPAMRRYTDKGNKGVKVDLWMASESDCRRHGIKNVRVRYKSPQAKKR